MARRTRRGRVSKPVTIPAPFRGWVTEENVIAGTPGTALRLENWFPDADAVRLRGGYASHCDTTETVAVDTLMVYNGVNGASKLFAASNATVYDVTSSTPSSTGTPTGLTNVRLQHVNFGTSGGNFLFFVNGADTAKHYNGSAWATPSITGTTSDNFTNVNVFKSRLYFTIVNSLNFAYLPTQAVAGAASTFDLGPEFNKGGYLMAMGTWTVDGGAGQDDHAVFITSEGQLAIYQGDDPSDANKWVKVGTYDLPRPIGRRCMHQVGGDLYIITEAGIVPLKESLALDVSAATSIAVTKNIQSAMNEAADLYGTNFGWQMISFAPAKYALLNVPINEGGEQVQFVMNSVTGSWCKFTNQNANCWAVMGNELYFGGNAGIIYKANSAGSDAGSDILATFEGYYDYFGARGLLKDWKMVQPIVYSDGSVIPSIGVNVDFVSKEPTSPIQATNSTVIKWDEFTWDVDSWPADRVLSAKWITLNGAVPGYAGALHVKVAAGGSGQPILLQLNAFNLLYEVGAPL